MRSTGYEMCDMGTTIGGLLQNAWFSSLQKSKILCSLEHYHTRDIGTIGIYVLVRSFKYYIVAFAFVMK